MRSGSPAAHHPAHPHRYRSPRAAARIRTSVSPRGEGIRAAGFHQIVQMTLARDRHQFLALLFGGRVQRDGQFRDELRLVSQFGDLRDDAGGRKRDAARAKSPCLRGRSTGGSLSELGQVQQRLALAHHDDVDAVGIGFERIVRRDAQDLADDFTWRKISLQAEQGRQAESAVRPGTRPGLRCRWSSARLPASTRFRQSCRRRGVTGTFWCHRSIETVFLWPGHPPEVPRQACPGAFSVGSKRSINQPLCGDKRHRKSGVRGRKASLAPGPVEGRQVPFLQQFASHFMLALPPLVGTR